MDRIEHSGVVERVDTDRVYVEITSHAACGGCRARQACGMSESSRKIIEVHTPDAEAYHVGEAVTVSVTKYMGATAVLLAYVVPFIVLICVVVAASLAGVNEGLAAILGIAAVVLYYGALWMGRRRVENKIHFTISK